MFDDDPSTVFKDRVGKGNSPAGAAFRLDFGGQAAADRLVLDVHGASTPTTRPGIP